MLTRTSLLEVMAIKPNLLRQVRLLSATDPEQVDLLREVRERLNDN